MINVLLVAIAAFIGYIYRDIRDQLKELKGKFVSAKLPEPEVTPGSYGTVGLSNTNKDPNVGLVEAKTPEQLEWENRQQLSDSLAGKK